MKIAISSGHGKHVAGASGLIDEVTEARRVVERVADLLHEHGHEVMEFHDDVSTTQQANLDAIVNFHNAQDRDLDVSVHFNCYEATEEPRGTEVLYLTQDELAARVAEAIAKSGELLNRGAQYRDNLAFLNGTDEPAILIEVCFVDSAADVEAYQANFELICEGIAAVGDKKVKKVPEGHAPLAHFVGPCSWFGGPEDMGVSPDEGLAFIYEYETHVHLFLIEQPEGTTGLARRLDPDTYYVACRWDYDTTPKEMLAGGQQALVRAGKAWRLAWPADWGPHSSTGRAADLSPGLLKALGLKTDDEVEVIYPAPPRSKPKGKKR